MSNEHKPIGIVYGMSADEYHAIDAMSNSALSKLKQSPRHYWAHYINPDRPARVETAPMFNGTLAHCAMLEADAMAARYVIAPEDAPRRPTAAQWKAKKPSDESQAAMAWWSDFNAKASGRLMVTAEQYETTRQQVRAVLDVPELAALLKSGAAEVSFFWVDPETGIYCKGRADWLNSDGPLMPLDLKTTSDASNEGFARTVAKLGYYRQAAWYMRGLRACGLCPAEFVFGVVTSDYPFIAAPYILGEDDISQGDDECDELLQVYAECKQLNRWPAFGPGYQLVTLPKWARRSEEVEVAYV